MATVEYTYDVVLSGTGRLAVPDPEKTFERLDIGNRLNLIAAGTAKYYKVTEKFYTIISKDDTEEVLGRLVVVYADPLDAKLVK